MATNAASYNPSNAYTLAGHRIIADKIATIVGEETGPVSGKPPPLSNETKAAVADAANASATGSHVPGQDTEKKVKTEKELEKERKKAEKDAKFKEKKAKAQAAAATPATTSKTAEKKAKAEKKIDVLPAYVEDTPAGAKKIIKSFDDPQYKAYNPIAVESAWYAWWEKEGFFKPEFTADGKVKPEGKFVIVEPPPNVTGKLHMGHALGNALQDVMIRWNRMHGKTTLWLPGCDHAGISTQNVVENMLWRREQKTRHDLGRPKFVETVWDWKNEYHEKINTVLRRMGGSFDWTREAFTMDENFAAAVTETFVTLHDQGIIYRGNRLVNWCTKLNTSLSNLEVVNEELTGRKLLRVPGYDKPIEFGIIVYFKYKIQDSDETIEVATTRPETMLGDTGVAVHPDDERYKHLVGKNAVHPFIEGRIMPIVADTYVEKEFGTGAVKITPAHDQNDFDLGKRHNLKFINILTDDGKMNENAGPYIGQKRFDVRYTIQEDLKKAGLYVDKKDNAMTVPRCDKSKDIIEPILKPQWWMKMTDMAEDALKAVTSGEIKILPESAEKSYIRWMSNVNDWCLSRQLWWGHQAPMYFAQIYGEENDEANGDLWFAGRTQEEAEEKARAALPGKNFVLKRDEDVLDTWFSSGLWPFATMGWPNKTNDLQELFPTTVLETGWDILFFWIARMIMFSIKLTGKVPFTQVYCHSLIRDSEGRKMSKSLGNVIDPQDVIEGIPLEDLHAKLKIGNLAPDEVKAATKYQKSAFPDGIPECGTDALRFALVGYTTGGGDIAFDIRVIHGYRKFCNKIYQATKYVLGNLDADYVPRKTAKLSGNESLPERWILHKMTIAAKEINQLLEDREFSKSTLVAYRYWYSELCDVYIENSKAIIQDGTPEEKRSAIDTLYTALDAALTMIHPYMPFLTEELWQRLPRRLEDKNPSIVLAKYPTYDASMDDPTSEAAYELVLGISKGIRSLIRRKSLHPNQRQHLLHHRHYPTSIHQIPLRKIRRLNRGPCASAARPAGCVVFSVSYSAAVFLFVKGRVDIDSEIAKASKKMSGADKGIEKQKKILADEGYREKVSEELQAVERAKLRDFEVERDALAETIGQFERLRLE
ncbi:Valine--tRNA ligase, mitochondrial [Lachnellula subtilissima]|uniref:Valine--tRNA ligase, mitochondrial n=1 Tax=Lachnellula subtilissima TaxID=602034 RepID=A0A8H8RT13_9HELO|nr:Valine--tRNA ligase, mitochondrial [Lachnellula subtilissima]